MSSIGNLTMRLRTMVFQMKFDEQIGDLKPVRGRNGTTACVLCAGSAQRTCAPDAVVPPQDLVTAVLACEQLMGSKKLAGVLEVCRRGARCAGTNVAITITTTTTTTAAAAATSNLPIRPADDRPHRRQVVLTIGNFMNVGSRNQGAFGFKVDFLLKVRRCFGSGGDRRCAEALC